MLMGIYMKISKATLYSHASPFARLLEKGLLKSLTQVGIRTLTKHQREQAAKYKVNIVEMKDFQMGFISSLEGPLYISLDIDVLDPAFAPGHFPLRAGRDEQQTIIGYTSVYQTSNYRSRFGGIQSNSRPS
jgi:arginase family enzyme